MWRFLNDSNRLMPVGPLSEHVENQGFYRDMLRNTVKSWGSLSRGFHWVLGIAIIGMIAYGWWMNHFPARPDKYFYRSIHADIGYVILLLTVIRLIWRGVNPTPALPDDIPPWHLVVSRISHWALYLVTIAVTMLGWALSGSRPHNQNYASFFDWFNVPQFTSPDKA